MALSPVETLVSVDDMLTRQKTSSTTRPLFDIPDVSKMNSLLQAHSKPSDLQDLVTRATRMQPRRAG
jgi:hypothetical protein